VPQPPAAAATAIGEISDPIHHKQLATRPSSRGRRRRPSRADLAASPITMEHSGNRHCRRHAGPPGTAQPCSLSSRAGACRHGRREETSGMGHHVAIRDGQLSAKRALGANENIRARPCISRSFSSRSASPRYFSSSLPKVS
jgi:hypothetical protein